MLEAKTLTIKKSTNKSGKVVNFVPEMVEDKELDHNSYQQWESDEPKKDVGQATNEVEILWA